MATRTTTLRVDREVHRRLATLAATSGQHLADVLRDATAALERERFAKTVMAQLDQLRRNPQALADYVADAELAVGDGITG
jgi:predicted transcriptional regulator